MDSNNCIPAKQQAEVILQIPEPAAAESASRSGSSSPTSDAFEVESMEDPIFVPKSTEILRAAPGPRKLPRPPNSGGIVRRRSISSSVFAKPKSRFAEQPPPPTTNPSNPPLRPPNFPYHGSPISRPPAAPKTPAAGDEEEDEEEVYKKEHLPETPKRRRFRLRTLIEWVILVVAMGCMIATLLVRNLQEHVLWGLEIWRWCFLVSVFCCGRLVTQWLITVLVFLIERNFILKKKVLYFVYGLKKSFQVCIWLALVLLTWSLLFNHGVQRSPKTLRILGYVTRALAALLLGSVIWMLKIVWLKLLATSFHMTRFFDRIQESIFHQYVLQMLSGPPDMEVAEKVGQARSMGQMSFRSVGKGKEWEEMGVIDVANLHRMTQDKVSASMMKGLINLIRTSGLRTLSDATDESFEDTGNEQKDKEITSEWEAKGVASRIFKNVAKTGYKYIEEEDLLRFLSKEEVDTVLPLFEGASETGRFEKSALRNWVVKAYLDRKSLAHSLNDTKTAVKQLHKLATAIVTVIIIVSTLIIMGVATTQILVILSSQLLLVGFMFQNSCKIVFEAIIFVFVMHPFDVGDRCVVDGVEMTVEEMNILTTVFLRYDNEKIYFPNSVLATKPISNFYRSPDMNDSVEFSVDVKTSMDCIAALKARIKTYIESKPNHWHPNHSIVVKGIVDANTMSMALDCQHTMNFQNIPEKNSRRTDLVFELKKIFEDLSTQYHLLPQQVHLSYTEPTLLPMAVGRSA